MRRSICLILIFALVFSVVATNTFFVQAQEKTDLGTVGVQLYKQGLLFNTKSEA